MKGIQWLKRMNARGSNVHIRPVGSHGLVLVAALKAESLAALRRKGFEPAVTVESTPGEFQAWVRLSARPVPDQVRKIVAESLARAVGVSGSDSNYAGYGVLAGLTLADRPTGPGEKRPFAVARVEHGRIASSGLKYLEHIEKTLYDRAKGRVGWPAIEVSKSKDIGRGR